MSAAFTTLGSVAEFINGAAFKPEDWGDEGTPIIRIQNLNDPTKPFNRTKRHVADKLYVRTGDLLVSWSASLGVFEWREPEVAVLNQHIFRVLPDQTRIEKRYLRHGLERALLDMQRHLHGATMQHVNRGEFLATKLYLPPLPEQRRIAEVLDRAEALRAKRRAALAQLDTLTQSIFLDMFGDPTSYGWRTTTIGSVASDAYSAIRTGPFGSQLLHSEFTEDGVAVLGIDNAVDNEFRWGQRRFISEEKYRQLSRYRVHPGDVLITIMGTCARCAIVPDDIPKAINTKHLCCITLNRAKCLPSFLHAYFLGHPIARRYLAQKAKGAIMEGLNMGIIKEMPIPLAPIELQVKFAERLSQASAIKAELRRSEAELEALFAALQHRAFRGEL